jgi:hypothetical protein
VLLTLTHARLRAQQGDAGGAADILRELLVRRPDDREAEALLASLPGAGTPHQEPGEAAPRPPTPAHAEALAPSFRRALAGGERAGKRRRLERFLETVTRHAR